MDALEIAVRGTFEAADQEAREPVPWHPVDLAARGRLRRRRRAALVTGAVVLLLLVPALVISLLPARDRTSATVALTTGLAGAPILRFAGQLPDGRPFEAFAALGDGSVVIGKATRGGARSVTRWNRRTGEVTDLETAADGWAAGLAQTFAVGPDAVAWASVRDGADDFAVNVWAAGVTGGALGIDRLATPGFVRLAVGADRVWWTVDEPGSARTGAVREAPLDGGPMRYLPDSSGLVPMPGPLLARRVVLTMPAQDDGGAGFSELGDEQVRALPVGRPVSVKRSADEEVNCGLRWCTVAKPGPDGAPAELVVRRIDGSDARSLGEAGAAFDGRPRLDRFVLITWMNGEQIRWLLYDLVEARQLALPPLAEGTLARLAGTVLIWATGDGDSLRWNSVDLRRVD